MSAIRMTLAAVGMMGLFACATPEPAPAPAPPPPPKAEAPPPPPPAPRDTCGAGELQYLVGRPKSEIPIPVDPSKRRVACTTCPVTMDYRADRLNIFFDADTGVVKEVKCG
ncbi:peptidase inhibitor I78 [Caulobacter sp. SLTY]|uniref:peptidase inhibitor I78 n=1 Tax=Caulobacter sp. SLTY TaxID=2683262 RepID=UPI001F0FBF34|nr:peptidase inhibitor I78 [Caulobacter sp. SLTY]